VYAISDIHGEDKKPQHVINDASGTFWPIVEEMFVSRMSADEMAEFLKLTFYPAEVTERLRQTLTQPDDVRAYAVRTLKPQLELLRSWYPTTVCGWQPNCFRPSTVNCFWRCYTRHRPSGVRDLSQRCWMNSSAAIVHCI
jgi:hypothetical protein